MTTLFELCFLALCVLIALETLALRSIMRETLWLTRLYSKPNAPPDPMEVTLGAPMPRFGLQVLDAEDYITDRDLRGQFTMLLFITRADVRALGSCAFLSMVQGLWSQSDDCLYIVCEGSKADCRWIRDHSRLAESHGEHVKILVADNVRLRTELRIMSTPNAVVFDEDGYVRKVGRPLAHSDADSSTLALVSQE